MRHALRRSALLPARPGRSPLGGGLLAGLLLAVLLPAGPAAADTAAGASAATGIYGDGLAAGWSDWSWGVTDDLGAAGRDGGTGIAVTVDRPWGGLYLHSTTPLPTAPDSTLSLSVRPSRAGSALGLVAYGPDLQPLSAPVPLPRDGSPLAAGTWTTLRVPLADLGTGSVSGLSLQDLSGTVGARLDVDDVAVSGPAAEVGPAPAPPAPAPLEVRPGNAAANAAGRVPTDPALFFGDERFRPYYDRVDGDHTGTTAEVLRWAAAKWGFDQLGAPDLAQAMAVVETWWHQEHVGAHGELGILQVNPGAWPDAAPAAWSTAYSADYAMAVVRSHYDGSSWLGSATKGDLRASVAAWECGCAGNGGGSYATRVFAAYDSKPWLRPGVAPEWF